MFYAKPFVARAAPSGLNFVTDEQAAMLARDLDRSFEITGRRNDETADAEDGLRHEGCNLARRRRHDYFFDVFGTPQTTFGISELERATITIRRWRMNDAGDLRRQRSPSRVAHCRQRRSRASAIAVTQHDDFMASSCQFCGVNCRIVGFSAAVREE